MIKAIIIDDEEKAIKALSWEIKTNCSKDVEVLATFTNPIEAIDYLKSTPIDCIFLDIEMPKLGGLQLLHFFPDRNFQVVFTTAYDQYAIQAIKQQAFDYLLKPIDGDDLMETVHNLKAHLNKEKVSQKTKDAFDNPFDDKISLSVNGEMIFLNKNQILYCKSDGNYCEVYRVNNEKKLVVTQKLKQMEELINSPQFMRVHNQYLINLSEITSFNKADSLVTLQNEKQIPISRQKKSIFMNKLNPSL